ncbi:MAG: hypothetical protein WBO34_02280 [Gammaproteobacteria bacterium]
MNIKALAGYLAGLCLLAATAAAAQDGKGIIDNLDLDQKRISIGNEDLIIDDAVRVKTVTGMIRTTDYLAERVHVDYTLNNWGRVSEIRIYDPQKLVEQGFYTSEDMNH